LAINENRQENLFRLELAGGPPRQLTHFTRGTILNPEISPDGKRIAYHRGTTEPDLVLLKTTERLTTCPDVSQLLGFFLEDRRIYSTTRGSLRLLLLAERRLGVQGPKPATDCSDDEQTCGFSERFGGAARIEPGMEVLQTKQEWLCS
jgi:hypothetical protein